MKSQNPREKLTTNFIPLSGVGMVQLKDTTVRAVQVVGMFVRHDWHFIIHYDLEFPFAFAVSEASTGAIIDDLCYTKIEYAYQSAIGIVDSKRYFFATRVKELLVRNQTNLFNHNSCIMPLINYL